MRFFRNIFYLLILATLPLQAQLPQRLPPGGAAQVMSQQPLVDSSPPDHISATALFDPPLVPAGGKTFYRVTVDATENSITWPDEIATPSGLRLDSGIRGQVPLVDGNRFQPITSFVYEVTPPAAGHFVISNFVVQVGGRFVEIPAAALDVSQAGSMPVPELRRLWLEVSATNLFFGQPFRVRVLLPAGPGNQIESLGEVQFNGNGYMTDKIATRQAVERVTHNGETRTAFFYETVATPLAAGPLEISAQGFTAGRNFSGQVIISGGGQVVIAGGTPAYVLLSSEPVRLNVRPLPAEGELPGFTGALGRFQAARPQLSANRLHVGDPVHLQYSFQAGTNLARFVPPAAPPSREWQIFADQPPGTGFTFIPLTDEVTETPAIPFSAFDPATEKYYDLTIPALAVTVSSDGLPVQLPAWRSTDTNAASLKLSGLTPTPGWTVASLRPLQLQGRFVLLQILPVLVFIALWRWDEHRRFLEAHPDIVRRRKARRDLRREKIQLQKAVAAADAAGFARHAAAAMRIAVAPHFPADAEALVGGDVLAQLDEPAHGETVRKIFMAADGRFAASPSASADLLALQPDVAATLQRLEARL